MFLFFSKGGIFRFQVESSTIGIPKSPSRLAPCSPSLASWRDPGSKVQGTNPAHVAPPCHDSCGAQWSHRYLHARAPNTWLSKLLTGFGTWKNFSAPRSTVQKTHTNKTKQEKIREFQDWIHPFFLTSQLQSPKKKNVDCWKKMWLECLRYMAKDPLRFPPPWSTYLAVSLKLRNMGTNPLL